MAALHNVHYICNKFTAFDYSVSKSRMVFRIKETRWIGYSYEVRSWSSGYVGVWNVRSEILCLCVHFKTPSNMHKYVLALHWAMQQTVCCNSEPICGT